MTSQTLPSFDDLPVKPGLPKGCAWGVFDKDGKKDVLGCVNLLTPDVVKQAYAEARDGVSVSLNWDIGALAKPNFQRKGLVHTPLSLIPTVDSHGWDDEVSFNTQCSSQWDSLCHFHHQPTQSGYNGVQTNVEELTQPFGKYDKDGKLPTLHHWHKRGGMVGRGVFIDFRRWADAQGRQFDEFDKSVISIEDIEAVAKHQGVDFRQGDIILVRSGFTEALGRMNAEEQAKALGTHRCCGVEGTDRAARWFWNHHFAGVAGDMIAFEHIPPVVDGKEGVASDLVLHQYFLGLFGLNIGELWDLEALSEHCAKTGRYTFLLSSIPLNVGGLIGSPPNAIAMF